MPGVIRLGDGSSHGGSMITASSDVTVNNLGVCRVTDSHSCPIPGHGVTAIVSSPTTEMVNNLIVAVEGAVAGCGATLVSGSSNTIAAAVKTAAAILAKAPSVADLINDPSLPDSVAIVNIVKAATKNENAVTSSVVLNMHK